MSALFRRHLAAYAICHRDARNCAMHCAGIPQIFLAVLIVLVLRPIYVPGLGIPIGTILLGAVALFWIALDLDIGLTILVAIVALNAAAQWIVHAGGTRWPLVIALSLFFSGWLFQIAGHFIFERRRPAFTDNLLQLLIGPMFLVAEAATWFGLRRDLAGLLKVPR